MTTDNSVSVLVSGCTISCRVKLDILSIKKNSKYSNKYSTVLFTTCLRTRGTRGTHYLD